MNQKNYKDKEKNEAYSKYMKLIGPLKKEKNIKEIAYMILLFEENIQSINSTFNYFCNITIFFINFEISFHMTSKNKLFF